jgi:hypothetical protein
MDNLEQELKKALKKNGDFDTDKSETLRKEIVQMWYSKNLRKTKIIFWIFYLCSIGMMIAGYIGLRTADDTVGMLSWVLFFMIGFNSTILMKLWYWVIDTKLSVLKEMKQLQLQMTELNSKELPAGN